MYYLHRQITHISHRTKTIVAAILYMSILGTSPLLARDHAIFTRKIAAELILITHFTNLILSTKSHVKDKRGKVYVAPIICFFSIFIMSHLPQTIDYFKMNYSFNHFLTTVNTAFVLSLCKRSVTRPEIESVN